MTNCPRGCDAIMEYQGITDGIGKWSEMCCDVYICPACGEEMIGDCMPCDFLEEIEDITDQDLEDYFGF